MDFRKKYNTVRATIIAPPSARNGGGNNYVYLKIENFVQKKGGTIIMSNCSI